MDEVEVYLPPGFDSAGLQNLVEIYFKGQGLRVSLKSSLSRYPGSIHWHFKRENKTGTLEVTWWEPDNRLWFKVAKNRKAAWIETSLPGLKSGLEQALHDAR